MRMTAVLLLAACTGREATPPSGTTGTPLVVASASPAPGVLAASNRLSEVVVAGKPSRHDGCTVDRELGPAQPDTCAKPRASDAVALTITSTRAATETTLTGGRLATQIQTTYLAGLADCYPPASAATPGLTLTLELSVGVTGRVTHGRATSAVASVEACATRLVTGWQFPIPRDAAGKLTAVTFTISITNAAR